MSFASFFRAVWNKEPFPWQERMAVLAMEGRWPGSIGLPTAAGKTALIDAKSGSGHIILFGMRPQYRAQSYLTFKLFFNALVYSL